MLDIFKAKQEALLGVDIGSSSIRVLELAKTTTGYKVVSYASGPMPENAVEGNSIKNVEKLGVALRELVDRSRTKTKSVAIAVPDSSVITKVVQLEEDLSDSEREELVILEADKYIPYPIDEVSIDYEIVGPSSKGDSLQDVLVVASRAENINLRIDLVKESGLDLKIVDVESYAVERACQLFSDELPDGGEDKTIAIFDIGEVYTQLTVLHNMKTIFSREEEFGGKQLTEELTRRYGLSEEDARAAKRKGKLPDDYESEILEPFKEMVGIQMKRALQFFFSTSTHSKMDQILLAGGSSQLPGLTDMVSSLLEVPTMLVNPIGKMSISKGIDVKQLGVDTPSLMIACGLALRYLEAKS
jgi:type IV pilus assembly protein PilM